MFFFFQLSFSHVSKGIELILQKRIQINYACTPKMIPFYVNWQAFVTFKAFNPQTLLKTIRLFRNVANPPYSDRAQKIIVPRKIKKKEEKKTK